MVNPTPTIPFIAKEQSGATMYDQMDGHQTPRNMVQLPIKAEVQLPDWLVVGGWWCLVGGCWIPGYPHESPTESIWDLEQ